MYSNSVLSFVNTFVVILLNTFFTNSNFNFIIKNENSNCVPYFKLKITISLTKRDMGGSPGELSEELVTQEKREKGWRMNCDVDEATEGFENEL